jgi:hypothetical protein
MQAASRCQGPLICLGTQDQLQATEERNSRLLEPVKGLQAFEVLCILVCPIDLQRVQFLVKRSTAIPPSQAQIDLELQSTLLTSLASSLARLFHYPEKSKDCWISLQWL